MASSSSSWSPQPDGLSQLLTCLRNSDSADTNVQQNVAKQLDSFNQVPDYNSYLAYILCQLTQEDPRVRSVAGLILKNNLRRIPFSNLVNLQQQLQQQQNQSTSSNDSTSHQVLDYIKLTVLGSNLLSDPIPMLRGTAGTVISTIVMQFGPESWPDALQALIQLTEGDDPLGKEGAFSTLSKICEDVPRKLEKMQINGIRVLDIMIPRLINHLKTSDDSKIKTCALICLNPFVQTGGDGSLTDHLQSYVQALFLSASDRSPEVRKNVCSALVSLLSSNPDILMPNLSQTVDFMLYSTQESDESVALEACEFWLAFGEDFRLKNHLAVYLEKIVPVLLRGMIYSEDDLLMLDNDEEDEAVPDRDQDIKPRFYGNKDHRSLDDTTNPNQNHESSNSNDRTREEEEEEEENCTEEDEDSDEDDIYAEWNLRKCSAAALDVIAVNFENGLLDYLLPLLKEYLFQAKWEHKEAAILALGAIAEGCLNGMKPHLSTLIPLLLNCLKDRKALVRSITCWTLGRYASWIISPGVSPEHKQNVFLPVMEGLLTCVLDRNKRVQEAGCSAFATLEEEAGEELQPYLLPILNSLVMAFRKYQQKNLLILYDALGTLADSVGPALATPELLQILMPSLIERWQKLGDDDQDLIPLLECLSSVVVAIGPAFLPYAPAVFERCVRIVASNIEGFALYMKHPSKYDLPDKTFLIVALDLLSGLTQGLGPLAIMSNSMGGSSSSNPTGGPLPPILGLLGTCLNSEFPEPSVRQSAFALVGDCAISCYDLLESYLPSFMPEVIRQIDAETPLPLTSVCNNAAWAAGEIAIKAGEKMREFVEPLLGRLVPVLTSSRVARSLTENSAVTIGRLSLACPQLIAPHIDKFIMQWCQALAEIKDNDEKDSAFRGMCLAIEINPHGLTDSFGFWLNAVGRWNRPSEELTLKFKALLHGFKGVIGEPQWSQTISSLSPQTAQRLQLLYQV
ncbi:armadillo-type protein [Phakopsora pachyrhizi]|uniref:Armadillo-type protein n=1 Tax=Phakopsora pachyrhizi TaxID=170000 RepID=A0AAV0ATA9_PHAPC|nr:armadillo-type protein [Phakopsora pachyrhizi]